MEHHTKLLIVGWGNDSTGFGRVLSVIGESLQSVFDIHCLALDGNTPQTRLPWTHHPLQDPQDGYGKRQFRDMMQKLKPETVLLHFDFWLYHLYRDTLKDWPQTRVLMYYPTDGALFRAEPMAPLQELDLIIPYTEFGRDELGGKFGELGLTEFPPMPVIGHGVDTDLFFPLNVEEGFGVNALKNRRRIARDAYFKGKADLEEAFIVLNASANRPRKELSTSIRGFELFARDKPRNVKLYIHADIERTVFDGKTIQALRSLWQSERLLLTSELRPDHQRLSNAELNLLYNACDLGLNTASAEGWGLIPTEHGAAGAAQLLPRHTNLPEIWGDAAIWMEPSRTSVSESMNIRRFHLDEYTVAEALENVYQSPSTLAEYSEKAYQKTHETTFDWRQIGEKWRKLLQPDLQSAPQKLAR
ncbi:MAG: glycosyltransferase [Bacteroidota bacterium]